MLEIQADKLPRIMACEGSIVMDKPDLPVTIPTESQLEGTAAHMLASAFLLRAIPSLDSWLGSRTPSGVLITSRIIDYVSKYTDAIESRPIAPTFVGVESVCDFVLILPSAENVQFRCRCDHLQFDGSVLYIDDFKSGFRWAEPEKNWTLIAHAIGYCQREQVLPSRVVFTIHQPQPYHFDGPIRPWEISGDQLAELHMELRDFFETRGTSLTTNPHCYKCPAYTGCPAARGAETNAIDYAQSIAFSDHLQNDDLSVNLDDVERAITVLEHMRDAFVELAQHRIEQGQTITNRMLEVNYGHSKFHSGITPEVMSALTGIPADKFAETKMVSPAAAKRAGAAVDIVNAMSSRPIIGKKLVRRDISEVAAKLFGGK